MRKRIAFISEHASPLSALGGIDSGGQNVYVDKLAKQLSALGYDIDVFTRWEDATLSKVVDHYPGIRVIHVQAGPLSRIPKEQLLPHMKEFADEMEAFIRGGSLAYELIHANFFMSGLVATELKKRLGIPFVITFHALGKVRRQHQGGADSFPDERMAIEERLIREADRVIAECPQDLWDLRTLYGAPRNKITIIPCGHDPLEFYPIDKREARAALGLSPGEKLILQLGRMVPRKGVETVIEALALMRARGSEARLLIVGGESEQPDETATPEIGRLRLIARRYGVESAVEFAGRRSREELKYFYSAADVFVTVPWYEPFGITPLEAMACGTPVIGSDVGGVKYSVANGETGLLVPPKDPSALAGALERIFSDSTLYADMKKNGPERVKRLFTWDAVARKCIQVYERVAKRSPASFGDALAVVDASFEHLARTVSITQQTIATSLMEAERVMSAALTSNKKLLIVGNGGSAADAEHFAAELVGRFRLHERRGLPALALTTASATVTAIANDFSYDQVFSRQVEALGEAGDVLIGISTSGNSRNVIEAFKMARVKGMHCIGFLGKGGGDVFALSDVAIVVPSNDTQRIQELHTTIIHVLCELIETTLFRSPRESFAPAISRTQNV